MACYAAIVLLVLTEGLRGYFEKYGPVEDVNLKYTEEEKEEERKSRY